MQFSADEYREGGIERLADAHLLLSHGHWTAAAYFAGRAVEGMLRALVRRGTAEDTSGHDLRDLLRQIQRLGLLTAADEPHLLDNTARIAAVWRNNLRYANDRRFRRHLKQIKLDRRLKGDPVEYWARRLVESSEVVLIRGELIWIRSRRK